MKKKTDQRAHRRFQVRIGAGAALNESKMGAITNISRGGLAFSYIDIGGEDEKCRHVQPELSIVHEEGFALENIPCSILGEDGSPSQNLFGSSNINQCHIQFGQLTSEQKSQLENFLDNFTDSPSTKHLISSTILIDKNCPPG